MKPEASILSDSRAELCPICGASGEISLGRAGQSEIRHCPTCLVSHIWPVPSSAHIEERLDRAFTGSSDRIDQVFVQTRARIQSQLASALKSRLSKGRVLDIGCGTGEFLRKWFDGPEWECWGNEVSAETASLAEQNGIRVVRGDLASAAFPAGYFDAVLTLDTFYYVPEPRRFLAEVYRLLKPGGLLLIELPFGPTRVRRFSRSSEPLDVFFYSPASLIHLLAEAGFVLRAVTPLRPNTQPGRIRNLLYTVYWLAAQSVWALSRGRTMLAPRYALTAARQLSPA
jgi:SAM-dependent methyltransferase